MPAPARLNDLVFIIVPTEGVSDREVVRTAQQACSIAVDKGLQPIHPLLLYGMYLPLDRLDRTYLRPQAMWWVRRAGAMWLCLPPQDEVDLDPLSYDILMKNEMVGCVPRRNGDPARLPVYELAWTDTDQYNLNRCTKDQLARLLRCNIVPGLLRGGLE